jgi:hypothetical protein
VVAFAEVTSSSGGPASKVGGGDKLTETPVVAVAMAVPNNVRGKGTRKVLPDLRK